MSSQGKLHIELTPPKQNSADIEKDLDLFASKFERVMGSGYCASITDNAMGRLAFQGYEVIEALELQPKTDQVLIHLNTFHTREELDHILEIAAEQNIRNFLALTGDGSDKMHKLAPDELEAPEASVTTSVELIRYIHRHWPDYIVGAAFNPYEPPESEFAKLERKLDAGIEYVITQPILGRNEQVDRLRREHPDLPVIVETWMSRKLYLLSDVIGKEIPEDTPYDPIAELKAARENYPDCGNYLSIVGFKTQYPTLEQMFPADGRGTP